MHDRDLPPSNPFATRSVRPGAIDYLFDEQDSPPRLVERLRSSGWWGQIVGAHGSGKSTLLATLIPALRQAGREVRLFTLRDGQRRLPAGLRAASTAAGGVQVVVDGYEQLSRLSRYGLKRQCRRRGWGLLATAHADVGLPLVLATRPTLQTALRIVDRLVPPGQPVIQPQDVERAYQRHAGDLREALFDLYDLYEARRQRPA